MNVTVTLEHRFDRTPDGTIWTQAMFAHPFWRPYLKVFDHVRVIARAREVSKAEPGWKRADGERVSFSPLPHFIGPSQYLAKAWQVRRVIRAAVKQSDAIIIRPYGIVSLATFKRLLANKHPFAVEVVADPYDAFAPGAINHPLRPFFRWWFSRQLRRQCRRAYAAAYVTEQALQRQYPAEKGVFTTYYSDVELPDTAFVPSPRPISEGSNPITLINVASFNMLYKAQDVLIDAVALCVKQGLDLRLVLIGDGRQRPGIESQARKRGLGSRAHFLGQLPAGDAVRAQLDLADLFVLPSRTEGLPRAMIEAMARALPCLGSTAGGIPELLPPEAMVPPGDATALARKIREMVTDPERLARSSHRNLEKARDYHEQVLRERRTAFYRYVKEAMPVESTCSLTRPDRR